MSAPDREARMRERLVLFVLAGIQFSAILDFMILIPLGPQLMRLFGITPTQFGFFTASYTVSASLSGFVAAFVVDRFDRRKTLLALYACFGATTLVSGLAPGYTTLLAARAVAGVFGGVLAAIVFSIVSDVIPEGRRGRAMGVVMSAFSVSSILGIPFSLYLAHEFGWRAPYLFLTGLCAAILATGWFAIPAVRSHLAEARDHNLVKQVRAVFGIPNHLRAFAFTSLLMFSGFIVFPFMSPYMVANVGVKESELPLVFFCAGLAALVAARVIGRLTDHHGKRRVFLLVAGLSALSTLIATNLPPVPLAVATLAWMFNMAMYSGRMVPAMTLVTSSVAPGLRGSFMSFNSSIQQFSAGVASFVASLIVGSAANGELTGFWVVGLLGTAGTLGCIVLARRVRSVPLQEPRAL